MGTFADYTGKMEVPEGELGEFTRQMEKVLNYGGMMEFENVNMFGCQLGLLVPFQVPPGGHTSFHYNYFEDDAWETASFDAKEGRFLSGKIGGAEFCDTAIAAYTLFELYDKGPGLAELNGDAISSRHTVGWLNHILGTSFSMEKHFRLWQNAEHEALRRLEYGGSGISYEALMDMVPRGMEYEACGTEFADLMYIIHGTGSLDGGGVEPGSYPADVLRCREAVAGFLEAHSTEGTESALEGLWGLLRAGRGARMRIAGKEGGLSGLAELSLRLPARVLAYLAAEHEGLDFWEAWGRLVKGVYHDEQMKDYAPAWLVEKRRKEIGAPVPPVKTSDYLRQDNWFTFSDTPKELKGKPNYYLSDDDRLYWWSEGSDEVTISEGMDQWLKGLAKRHACIMGARNGQLGDDQEGFLKGFLELLTGIEDYYKRVFPFQGMFYDFIQNSGREEYLAAVELLKELAEENRGEGSIIQKVGHDWGMTSKNVTCNAARLRLKRYLSVMANRGLRKKYFGF